MPINRNMYILFHIQVITTPLCYGTPVRYATNRFSSSLDHKGGTRSKIWKSRQVLTVFFRNKQRWLCGSSPLTVENIMEWAGTWNLSVDNNVPKFEMVPMEEADIRVKFSSKNTMYCLVCRIL